MANVIKHKRGSGSDPGASDLILGELAIRTDTGKLFTKMDSGAIAEIAGGGSDIAINTLSSSSGTGGGSATFNGSAYRFTLSAPPNVSAAQLLVSINGVIQKPVAGTGQPSEGFSVDGTDIILGDAPATGSDFFILTFKSLGVSEPADNSVTSAKIVDGAIVNADINASAAIAGSKISPDFGSQAIATTGSATIGTDLIHAGDTDTKISFGTDLISLVTNGVTRMTFTGNFIDLPDAGTLRLGNSNDLTISHGSGGASNIIHSNTSQPLKISATGAGNIAFLTNSNERMRIDSSGNVGIGATSITANTNYNTLQIQGQSGSGGAILRLMTTDGSTSKAMIFADTGGLTIRQETNHPMVFSTNNTERMRIDSSGNVGIGTTSPTELLDVEGTIECLNELRSKTGNDLKLNAGSANRDVFLQVNDSTLMTVQGSTGNVGIGTTSPASPIHSHLASSDANRIRVTNSTTGATASDGFIVGLTSAEEGIVWNYENSDMLFGTNNTERMRIDSSGKVIVKTNGINLENATATNSRTYSITNAAGTTGWTFGNGVTASSHQFVIYDNTAGAARMLIDSSGRVGINTTSPAHKLDLDNGSVRFNRGNSAGEILLLRGLNANQFRFDTDGLKFGSDTAAANALSDYEEGTWTPTLPSGASATMTGQYTKIGNKVFWALQINSLSGSGAFLVSGLPYTVNAGWGGNISIANDNHSPEHIYVFAHNGSSDIYFRNDSNVTYNISTFSGHFFYCSGFYQH